LYGQILVLSPHRDDAAFSIGCAIESWVRAGQEVTMINIFTESAYSPNSTVPCTVESVGLVRAQEDRTFASALAGPIRILDLNRLDAPLRNPSRYSSTIRCVGELPNEDESEALNLAGQLSQELASLSTETFLLVPLALGNHVDHRVVHASAKLFASKVACFGFYEDLPYAGELSENELRDHIVSVERTWGIILRPHMLGSGGNDEIEHKRRIAQVYESQLLDEDMTSILRHAHRMEGRERIWISKAR